jgi:hypothetical protein
MKNTSKSHKKFAKLREELHVRTAKRLEQEALTNPRLAAFKDVDPYFWSFGSGSRLVALVPVADKNHPLHGQHDYYSTARSSGEGRLAPAFLIEPHETDPEVFIFDSERRCGQTAEHLKDNPVVLIFKGCDDGHVGRRFQSVQDAMDYLDCMLCFEDIFQDSEIAYHN